MIFYWNYQNQKLCHPLQRQRILVTMKKNLNGLCSVFDWITSNFEKDIKLAEAAQIAQMNENAFSRFFSLRTRKTFSGFVQELRLQKAAKLLVENDMTITEVCYECGYNNVSNFNRQFLNHYQMNPMRYKKMFLSKLYHDFTD